MFKSIQIILILLIAVNYAHCTEREIIYGFDAEFPPFSFMENGKPTGFDIEILESIFENSDVNLVLIPKQWAEVQKCLKDGTIHLTSGMAKTSDREEIFDFSDQPLSALTVKMFVRDNSLANNMELLKTSKVSTQKGSWYQTVLEDAGMTNIKLYKTEFEALEAVSDGEVEAFGGAAETAYYNLSKNNLSGIHAFGTPLKRTSIYFVIRKDDLELQRLINSGLEEIIQNGKYYEIYRKWFVEKLSEDEIDALISSARDASVYAYAPYSNYYVGAAVLTKSGYIYTGCNIENALFGLTVSAIKVALYKAISEGDTEIKAIANFLMDGSIGAPTAGERQIIYEFGRDIQILMGDNEGNYRLHLISELLPYPFELE